MYKIYHQSLGILFRHSCWLFSIYIVRPLFQTWPPLQLQDLSPAYPASIRRTIGSAGDPLHLLLFQILFSIMWSIWKGEGNFAVTTTFNTLLAKIHKWKRFDASFFSYIPLKWKQPQCLSESIWLKWIINIHKYIL